MCDKCSGNVKQCLEMSREVNRFLRKAHAEKVRNFYRDQGREQERKRIIELLENSFYPLDYARWQADELMEEIFELLGKTNDIT